MATFGNSSQNTNYQPDDNLFWYSESYTCPGSGNKNIQSLLIYCDQHLGASNIRIGVYSSDGSTLIAEGTAAVAITTTPSWQGHATQADVKAAGGSSPGVLVGGTSYKLAWTCSVVPDAYVQSGVSGSLYCTNTDYTGGMPSALPGSPTNIGHFEPAILCDVESAGGRTTKNTRSFPLGIAAGMNRRM